MLYTEKDLETCFGKAWVSNGTLELREHGVVPNVQHGGKLITAMIDTGRLRIRVYVKVRPARGGGVRVDGECSCPARRNCCHVSAVLLKALRDEQTLPDRGSESVMGRDRPEPGSSPRPQRPPGMRQRLVYVLSCEQDSSTSVRADARYVKTTAGGNCGDDRRYEPAWALRGTPPRFLLRADLEILTELRRVAGTLPVSLQGARGERMLRAMLATGRCHLNSVGGRALALAEPQPVKPCWQFDRHGGQRLSWDKQPVVLLAMPWYLDERRARCVPLQTDMPADLVGTLMAMAPVPPEQVSRVTNELRRRYPGVAWPALHDVVIEDYPVTRPRPCLQLCDRGGPVAMLSFEYHGIRVGRHSPAAVFVDATLKRLPRDEQAERGALEQLVAYGLSVQDKVHQECDPLPWLDLQFRDFNALAAQGWRCSVAVDFPYRLARAEHWYGELETLEGDRCSVTFGVRLDGRRVNLLPLLAQWLRSQPQDRRERDPVEARGLPLRLPDGRFLLLGRDRARQILDTFYELYDERLDERQRLRLGRFQLLRLAELSADAGDDEPLRWLGHEQLQRLAGELRNIETIPRVDAPAGLRTELRPYQQQGLDWLQFLREHRLAGILADDMGLGKTVQALAHLLCEKEQGRLTGPSLVVVPTSLLDGWRGATQRFAPDLAVRVLHGPQRHALYDELSRLDLVITSYPLLLRDRERLLAQEYYLLILDEAQIVKNPRAKASAIVRECKARHRLCLTGTPLENHLGELWALFDLLLPGLLGNERQFRLYCRKPIENDGDEGSAERLRRRIRPFLLRRTKQAVAPELPSKTEILHTLELTETQRELYENIRRDMHRRVRAEVDDKGVARSGMVILSALLKLRQVCCDPRLLGVAAEGRARTSVKLAWLLDVLPEMIAEGRRVLLFSQFTSMLALIEQAVQGLGIEYVKLTGDVRDRSTPIGLFQSGAVRLFLVSLKAGGVGLNLTAADTVIHYDPWWNPAAERQATDRAHRIGQENPVFVYRLISTGTVEERIQALQARKQALADGLYDRGGGANPQWTEDDVEELFRPLS